jgi:hypothetical protein
MHPDVRNIPRPHEGAGASHLSKTICRRIEHDASFLRRFTGTRHPPDVSMAETPAVSATSGYPVRDTLRGRSVLVSGVEPRWA